MTERALLDLVGDYVLGVLDGDELRDFETALRADPSLRERVDSLSAHLKALDDTAEAAPVPADLWSRVEGRVTPQVQRVVPMPRSRRLPQWAALAASVVIAGGLGFIAGRSVERPDERPLVIAVLLSDGAVPGAIIEAFADNRVHIVPLADLIVPAGKILEVWTKPTEDIGPVSLGRFLQAHEIVLPAVPLPTPQAGQLYEITLEDAPGSPTGKPTGPILVKGFALPPVI